MDLERAALLADQLLARIVYEHNVRRAAGVEALRSGGLSAGYFASRRAPAERVLPDKGKRPKSAFSYITE